MNDQAEELRQLARQRPALAAPHGPPRPRLLVVSGGKGGVGTTTIALSLAIALARRGHGVALVDAAPHGGDVALRCRLQDRYTLADVLAGKRTAQEALQTGPEGIRVLPGTWGFADLSEAALDAQQRLVEQLQSLGEEADCVVLDAGNGLNRMVRRFWLAADAVLLVTTPELASVMAAYGSIKVLAAGDDRIPLRSLVTMAPSPEVADDVHARLARACRRFLGIQVQSAGCVLAGCVERNSKLLAGARDGCVSPTLRLDRIAQMLAVEAKIAVNPSPKKD